MNLSFFFAVTLFGFVMSVTPGPNNMMLLASGAQFGYRRTLPHICGIILGIAVLLASVLAGLGIVFDIYPLLYRLLKGLGCAYLLYLSWKIATAESRFTKQYNKQQAKPMSLLSASFFQFINPKAWAMVISSVSTFTVAGEHYTASGLWIMAVFALTGFIAISLWAYLGGSIGQLLTTATRRRYFNWAMGMMTASTLILIVFD